jgi:hypothetical protein
MAKTPDKLAARLDAWCREREKAERALAKRRRSCAASTARTPPTPMQVAKVNELKAEIGRISNEHAELARAVSLVSGGTNHAPPAG